jgi:hypothetical protein
LGLFPLPAPFFFLPYHGHKPWHGSMGMIQMTFILFIFDSQICENNTNLITVENDHVQAELLNSSWLLSVFLNMTYSWPQGSVIVIVVPNLKWKSIVGL